MHAPTMVPSFVPNVSNRACISAMSASYAKAFTACCGLASATDALIPAGSGTTRPLFSSESRKPWSYHDSTPMVGAVGRRTTGVRAVLTMYAEARAGMSAAVKRLRLRIMAWK